MSVIKLQEPKVYQDISMPFGLLSWQVNGKVCFSLDYRCLPGGADITTPDQTVENPVIPDYTVFFTTDGRVVNSLEGSIIDPKGDYSGVPQLIWQIW